MQQWQKNLAAMWFAQLIGMISISFVSSFIVLYLGKEMGIKDPADVKIWAGILLGINPLVSAILSPFWGYLGDRFGRKPMIIRALTGNFVTIFLMGFVPNVYWLLVLRIIQGCFGGVNPPSTALTTSQTPEEKLGHALGIIRTAIFAGSAAGPLMGGLVADLAGYRWAFMAMAFLSLISSIFVLLVVKEEYRPTPREKNKGSWEEIRTIVNSHWLVVMLFVTFLVSFATMNVQPIFPLMVQQVSTTGGYIASISGLILFVSGAVSAVVSVVIAGLGNKIGYKKVLFYTTLGAGVFFFLHAFATTLWQLFIFRVMAGAFMGGMLPTRDVMISFYIPPEKRGTAYGIVGSSMMFGNVVGPMMGGKVAAVMGLNAVYWGTGIIFIAAIIWIGVALQETYGPKDQNHIVS